MNPHLEHAIRHWVQHAEGWSSEERVLEMCQLVLDNKPKVVAEVGIFGGRHMVAMAMALRENGFGKIYGIDAWKLETAIEGENAANREWWSKNIDINKIHQLAMDAIWKYGLDEYAIVIRAASQNCHELFKTIDFLSIDGCHSEIASCRDVVCYLPKVPAGGLIQFDDSDWPTTQKALAMVDEQCDLLKDGKNYRIYRKR